jgi:hypothetical protein
MVVEKRKEVAEKMAALTQTTDEFPTAIPELTLFRHTRKAVKLCRKSLLNAS